MDPLEEIYRKRPNNKLALQHYISFLYEQDHIIEAQFYFNKLYEIDQKSIETNKLGFLIDLKTINNSVSKYDRNLAENGADKAMLYTLHLHYYYTYNDRTKMKDCLLTLLDFEVKDQYSVNVITDVLLDLKDYETTKKFISVLLPKLKMPESLERQLKKICHEKIVSLLKAAL